jgi:hypothetical protein
MSNARVLETPGQSGFTMSSTLVNEFLIKLPRFDSTRIRALPDHPMLDLVCRRPTLDRLELPLITRAWVISEADKRIEGQRR